MSETREVAETTGFVDFTDDDWLILAPELEVQLGSKTISIRSFSPEEIANIARSQKLLFSQIGEMFKTVYMLSNIEKAIESNEEPEKREEYLSAQIILTAKKEALGEDFLASLPKLLSEFPQLFEKATRIRRKDLERMSAAKQALVLDAVLKINIREGSEFLKNFSALIVSGMSAVSLMLSVNTPATE